MIERVPDLIARLDRVLAGSPGLREAIENSRDTLEHLRGLMEEKARIEHELQPLKQQAATPVA
jgi:hypothetical protein